VVGSPLDLRRVVGRVVARTRQLGPPPRRPPGVFLLDTKMLNGTAAAGSDSLRSGRLSHQGVIFRSGARKLKDAIEKRLGSTPWVEAVVIVWGDRRPLPRGQRRLRPRNELDSLLSELPERFNPLQRAAHVVALREVRAGLL